MLPINLTTVYLVPTMHQHFRCWKYSGKQNRQSHCTYAKESKGYSKRDQEIQGRKMSQCSRYSRVITLQIKQVISCKEKMLRNRKLY